jgi:predicted nucleic acid-binding protein
MKIMIDTSVWIECGKDADLRLAIEKIGENNEIRSSEIIDEEIERAYDLLIRQKRHGESKFWELYFKLKKATVKESETVKSLTNEYYKEGQKIKLKVGQMIADLTIVASASLDNADFILTLNRKTMSSDLARNVYSLVNSRRKLKTLQFLTDKLSIRRFANAA